MAAAGAAGAADGRAEAPSLNPHLCMLGCDLRSGTRPQAGVRAQARSERDFAVFGACTQTRRC